MQSAPADLGAESATVPPAGSGVPAEGSSASGASASSASTEIASLPPEVVLASTAYPVSPRTGEPRRPPLVLAVVGLGWAAVALTIGAFAWWWWQAASVTGLNDSARLLGWVQPDPVSVSAVVLVMVIGLIALLMVAAAGVVAYNTWSGQSWIRVGALVCLAVGGLSGLLNWWFMAALVPLALAAGLLWLPAVGRFLRAMDQSRAIELVRVPTSDILYGPQPLIGRRG